MFLHFDKIVQCVCISCFQVAHFEPDIVRLYGEGVFPRISLDLPRYIDDSGYYESLLKEARKTLMPEGSDHTLPPAVSLQDARLPAGAAPVMSSSSRNIDGLHQVRQHGLCVWGGGGWGGCMRGGVLVGGGGWGKCMCVGDGGGISVLECVRGGGECTCVWDGGGKCIKMCRGMHVWELGGVYVCVCVCVVHVLGRVCMCICVHVCMQTFM